MTRLELQDGKYTIIRSDDCSQFEALRHGELWRILTGDNLIHALVDRIESQQEYIEKLESFMSDAFDAHPNLDMDIDFIRRK